MSGIVGSRRYGAAALLLAVAGGLIYYFVGPGGVSNTAPRATGYDPVEGYGTACELFYPLAVRDDFTAVLPGWAGTDRGKVSDDAGRLRMKPAAGESLVWLYRPIEFEQGFVCAKVQRPEAAAPDGAAGVAFWANDPSNYYAAAIYRDGGYAVFRKVNGVVVPLVPKRPFAGVKPDDVNILQVLYSEPRYALLINGQPAASFELPSGSKSGMIGLFAESARDSASEWEFSGVAAGSDRPLRKSVP
jgi:hypothetical protein